MDGQRQGQRSSAPTAGLVKVITEPKYGQILGIHILGGGDELVAIGGMALATRQRPSRSSHHSCAPDPLRSGDGSGGGRPRMGMAISF